MKTTYATQGTCARFIDIETDGETVTRVNFIGGCNGNTSGLSALLQGMNIANSGDTILNSKGEEI